MSNFEKLRDYLIPLSESDSYTSGKREWELVNVQLLGYGEHETCPCGQTPIKELCYIRNKHNGKVIFVGNVCVKRFMDIDTGNLFEGIKRLLREPDKANPSKSVVEHAWKFGFLFGENEYSFLLDIHRKRNLSEKQINWRNKIVRRILNQIVVNPSERKKHNP